MANKLTSLFAAWRNRRRTAHLTRLQSELEQLAVAEQRIATLSQTHTSQADVRTFMAASWQISDRRSEIEYAIKQLRNRQEAS